MSVPERRAMVERPGENLSVRRQCALLNLARSGVYRPGPVAGADDLALMRRIDELHLKRPFYGSRRMAFELNQAGHGISRKRVQRLMRVMGIEALVPRPGTSKAAPGHKIYPYLLRGAGTCRLDAGVRQRLFRAGRGVVEETNVAITAMGASSVAAAQIGPTAHRQSVRASRLRRIALTPSSGDTRYPVPSVHRSGARYERAAKHRSRHRAF